MNNVLNEASTSHRSWNNLSMQEKAAMIRVAVKNGLTDLKTIREKYNEFAGGGYLDWKEKASKYKHLDIDNDRTYDYEGWYNENPQRAWNFLNDNPDAHFDDKYKTVYHPTFSTQSKYSGVVDPVFNPDGLVGGTWNKQGTVFTMSPDGYRGPVSMDERAWYLMNAEDNGVQLREADGSLPVFDGIPWGGVLPTVTVSGNRFAGGGKKRGQESISNAATQHAMKYFMGKGLTDYQAAGLVGNLFRESRLIPTATNAGSGAYGIAQWLGDRKKNLFAKYGKNPTLNQQLDYVWHELGNTHRMGLKAIKSSKNAEEAARNAMGYYEFSAGPEAAIREMRRWGQDGEGAMQKGINFASQLIGGPVVPFRAETPQWNNIPFTPANPEVFFGNPVTTSQPVVDMEPTKTPMLEYDPKEAERQEKRDNLNRFNMFLGMLNGSNESTFPFSMFAEGGGIHIKPENRGKFTALKERTGHSATWFKEHGTPAQKKMATFALNSRHWKHGLGGNLFEDGGPKKPLTRDDLRRMLLNRRAEAETAYNGSVTETQITPNDNAWVDKPLTRRKKNPHSSRRAEEGAKAHAAWEREHPNLAAWGNLAGAIPFAVAAAPLGAGIVAGGDALAATTAGQAITSGLAPLYQAATGATIAGAPALTWADAGLTSAFGAHGISQAVEDGGISPMAALEIAPLGRMARPVWNAAANTGTALYNDMYIPYKVSRAINKGVNENPVITAYNRNPITKELGTLWDYQSYLDNVFPNSKFKGVLWHGSKTNNLQEFDFTKIGSSWKPNKNSIAMYLTPEKDLAKNFAKNKVSLYPVLLDTQNPYISSQSYYFPKNGIEISKISQNTKNTLLSGNDAVIAPKLQEVAFFEPKNALILGSDADVAGFKRFMSNPQITAENAASITPEQWTAAQDAAIARGDMAEAQRLRDLHFKISAPNTKVVDGAGNPQLVYHKTPEEFTVFDNNRSIGKLNWFATPNAYGENGVFATGAGKNPHTMKLYVNMKNPHKPTIDEGIEPAYINEGEDGILGIVDENMTNYFPSSNKAGKGFMMSGGVDNPYALKSVNTVTYDNNGVRIPLGERDNFSMNDIRYGLLPFGIGLTGYGLLPGK